MVRPLEVRVLALVTLPTLGAGNRLRIEQYAVPLKAFGIELVVSSFFDAAAYRVLYRQGHTFLKLAAGLRGIARRVRDLARVRRFDLVVIYRESAPIGPPLFERILGLLGIPYVFDFDDAIFLGPIHPANRWWARFRDPSRVGEAARRACAVIAGNEYLASWAREYNPRVTVLTTPVDTERHRPAEARHHAGTLVLGWVGSSTTAPYLTILDEPLALLASRRDLLVRVVGGAYSHPSVPVESLPYDLDRESSDLTSFDIGLLPEPDDAWTRGKGAFKALLYMATGVPVVASNVGVNADVIKDGETGFCVDAPAEWVAAIDRLAADPELRRRLGAAGRERVERLYSLRALAPRFANVLLNARAVR
jgi:glycosyltransferase involved in cell wall biosynthesis